MKSKILVPLTLVLSLSSCSYFHKESASRGISSYSDGNSCISSGRWMSDAISASQSLKAAIDQMRDQDECQGLVTLFEDIQVTEGVPSQQEKRDTGANELRDLTYMARGSSWGQEVVNSIFGKTLENAYNKIEYNRENASTEMNSTQKYGIDLLNNVLREVPNYRSCLVKKPSALQAMAISAIRLTSSHVGSTALSFGLDSTISNLLGFFREIQFSEAGQGLQTAQFFNELSCLVESVTDKYCRATDALQMLDDLRARNMDRELKREGNPLEGYLVLTRDTEVVSTWLLKVMFGVEPKLLQDAEYKNGILTNVNGFLEQQNTLPAQLNNIRREIMDSQDIEAKRTILLNSITDLAGTLMSGRGGRGSSDNINFYERVGISREFLPFMLIGMSEQPTETITRGRERGMSFDQYSRLMGNRDIKRPAWIAEFQDPLSLYNTVKRQVNEISRKAAAETRSYFRQRLIIDIPNLSTETVANSKLTVKQALKNIHSYLTRVFEVYREAALSDEDNSFDVEIIPFTANTIMHLEEIIKSLDSLQDLVRKEIRNTKNLTHEELINKMAKNEELKNAYTAIIDTVYKEFNILLQRDTFLQSRIETMVKFEYSYRIKNKDILNENQDYLIRMAGEDVVQDVLSTTFSENNNDIFNQLTSAMEIHRENLVALEALVSDSYLGAIRHLKNRKKSKGSSGTIKDFVKESMSFPFGLLQPVMKYEFFSDQYFTESYSYKKPTYLGGYYDSSDQFISRLCIQSLAFKDKSKFIEHCNGAILRSIEGDETLDGIPLEERYDRLMLVYEKVLNKHAKDRSKGVYEKMLQEVQDKSHTCAFRNYLRRNRVYNIVRKFNQ